MRLKLVILALSLLATTALQAAITLPWDTPKPDTLPAYLDGSMMPYDFSACDPVPQWPDSLRPVFVAYVARHGARYLSGPKKVDELEKILAERTKAGKITREAKAFYKYIKEVWAHSDGNWGALSPEGVREEKELARQMPGLFPALGKGLSNIDTRSTFVPRAMMTMYQFNHEMMSLNDSLEFAAASGRQFSPLLYFFDTDTAYASWRRGGEWEQVYDEFLDRHVSIEPAQRLLGDNYTNNKRRLRHLTMQIYGVIQANRASGLPAPTTAFMTVEEYRGCWLASNLLHYLRNNISPLNSSAGAAAAPLLLALIESVDKACSPDYDGVALQGWFGHAETLLPLFSLMRLPGCFALPLNWDNLADEWRLQEITPLGANLAILILRSVTGRHYAAVRLNGRTVAPIQGAPSLLPWKQLADFWREQVRVAGN